jgi:hypothetical protein
VPRPPGWLPSTKCTRAHGSSIVTQAASTASQRGGSAFQGMLCEDPRCSWPEPETERRQAKQRARIAREACPEWGSTRYKKTEASSHGHTKPQAQGVWACIFLLPEAPEAKRRSTLGVQPACQSVSGHALPTLEFACIPPTPTANIAADEVARLWGEERGLLLPLLCGRVARRSPRASRPTKPI